MENGCPVPRGKEMKPHQGKSTEEQFSEKADRPRPRAREKTSQSGPA